MFNNIVVQSISDIKHTQWMSWAKTISEQEPISKERLEKYFIDYDKLPEEIKEYDRKWAFKCLEVISTNISKFTKPKLPYFTPLITTPTEVPRVDCLVFPMFYKFNNSDYILIPSGLRTDYASIPRPLWVLLPPRGNWSEAAVLHDYMYKFNGKITIYTKLDNRYIKKAYYFINKSKCDEIFYNALLQIGVNKTLAKMFFVSVYLFGLKAWIRHLKTDYEDEYKIYFPEVVYSF